MAQFHVYLVPGGRLVLDLQNDLFEIGTRVVAPLMPADAKMKAISRLEPEFTIDGVVHVLHTAEMAAVPSAMLKDPPIVDLTRFDYEIRLALDMVFSGF